MKHIRHIFLLVSFVLLATGCANESESEGELQTNLSFPKRSAAKRAYALPGQCVQEDSLVLAFSDGGNPLSNSTGNYVGVGFDTAATVGKWYVLSSPAPNGDPLSVELRIRQTGMPFFFELKGTKWKGKKIRRGAIKVLKAAREIGEKIEALLVLEFSSGDRMQAQVSVSITEVNSDLGCFN